MFQYIHSNDHDILVEDRGGLIENNDEIIELCGFCGRTKSEVDHLIQGIDNNFICDACASYVLELLSDKNKTSTSKRKNIIMIR